MEAEPAFVMKRPLEGRNLPVEAILEATRHVVPAVEILDTRIVRKDPETGRLRTLLDTFADNAANAGIVVGYPIVDFGALHLPWIGDRQFTPLYSSHLFASPLPSSSFSILLFFFF